MTIGYLAGAGVLHRAHPFTPLTLAVGFGAAAFLLPPPLGPLVVLAAVIGLTAVAGVRRVLPTAIAISAPFWIFLGLIHGVFRGEPLTALGLAARISAAIVAFLMALAVVHPGRLVEALLSKGVPFSAAYLLAAALQTVPRFRDRARAVLDAQRCRGLRLRGSPGRRARAILALAIPLVLGALAEVDEHTLALEARGVGAGVRRTALHPPPDTLLDRAVRWLVVATVAVAVVVAIR